MMQDINGLEWDKYRITIIMANYNKEYYIKQAIESVLMQQTTFSYILAIVDDCSTDHSRNMIKAYEELYPDKILTIFSDQNEGYYKSQMKVYQYMKTDYYTLLDPDDYWTSSHILEESVSFLDKNKDYVVCGFNSQIERAGKIERESFFCMTDKDQIVYEGLTDYFAGRCIMPHTSATIYRNDLYKNGIPDLLERAKETLAEASFRGDTDRFVVHLKYGKILFINKLVSVYRIYEGGIWSGAAAITKYLMHARAQLDYSDFYDREYEMQFAAGIKWDKIEIIGSVIREKYVCRECDRERDRTNYHYVMQRLSSLSEIDLTENEIAAIWRFLMKYAGEPVIIWGCGNIAEGLLTRYPFVNIKFFVDSNVEKQGRLFHGIPVKAPEEIEPGCYVILMSSYYQEIREKIQQEKLINMDRVINLSGYDGV